MFYNRFYDYFPKIAQKETRTITVLEDYYNLPRGHYGLIEMYCSDQNCDCRRVFLNVVASWSGKSEAIIAFGWESENFYAKWYGIAETDKKENSKQLTVDDRYAIEMLKGPCLNPSSPQGKYAELILEIVTMQALLDLNYVDRIKKHYKIFKKKLS